MLLRSDLPWSLRPSRALAIAVAATFMLGTVLTLATIRLENRAAANRFDRVGDLVASSLRQRMTQHRTLLRATGGMLVAQRGQIGPNEFAAYVSRLKLGDSITGIQGIGFAPIIAADEGPAISRQLSQMYGQPLDVVPTSDQTQRAPVVLIEPRDARNHAALGFDMMSEPVRRAAITAALASDEPRASGPVELRQEITADKQIGFLIFLRAPTVLDGIGGRGVGVVYAPFRAGDLFQAVLAGMPDLPATVRAIDLEDPAHPLFDNAPTPPSGRLARQAITREIRVSGRRWQLTVTPTAPLVGLRERSATLTVGLLSLLLLGAVAVAMSSLGRSLDAARRTAALAERQAADRALLLREMQHRIKNHIARIQAISRQSARDAADLPEFERVFGGRLAAMAKAQDVLVAGGPQHAEIRTLLRAELSQVLDGAAVEVALSGPDIRLAGREAQAFGLVAHELVTNAMKYRADPDVKAAANDMTVAWRIADQSGNPWLQLDWIERAVRTPAKAKGPGGFGTQLVEALIEGDLGGRFSRSFTEAGMHVSLGFPLPDTDRTRPEGYSAS